MSRWPLVYLVVIVASTSGANVQKPKESSPSGNDIVPTSERANQVHWQVERAKLAPESQIVSVNFDAQNEALNLRAATLENSSNATKQTQDFDTHQQQQQQQDGSTTSGPQATSSAAPLTSSSQPPAPSTEAEQQQQQTSTSSTTTTTETPGGWPVQSGMASSTTTEAPASEAPVGSKTARQGSAVLCGEANANGKSNKKLAQDRIVGGYKTEPGEFPFQVRLNIRSRRGSGICGGVIIDETHILTAAHCMTACVSHQLSTTTIESTGVRATIGDHSIRSNDGELELEVEKITPHEKYDACNFYANDHDIALIKTSAPMQYRFTTDGYGSINRPCMPVGPEVVYRDGEQVIVSGWGVTRENSGALSNILRYVQVPIVNVTRCQDTYGSRVTQDHVCAGLQAGGKDSCQGDSGGPLVRVVDNRYELVGVVSFGYGCGQPSAPGVYTRVASYIDWIKANL